MLTALESLSRTAGLGLACEWVFWFWHPGWKESSFRHRGVCPGTPGPGKDAPPSRKPPGSRVLGNGRQAARNGPVSCRSSRLPVLRQPRVAGLLRSPRRVSSRNCWPS